MGGSSNRVSVAELPRQIVSLANNNAAQVVNKKMAYLQEKADDAYTRLLTQLDEVARQITDANMPGTVIDYSYVDDEISIVPPGYRPEAPTLGNTNGVEKPVMGNLLALVMPDISMPPEFNEQAPKGSFHYD